MNKEGEEGSLIKTVQSRSLTQAEGKALGWRLGFVAMTVVFSCSPSAAAQRGG